jgi:hypothetical protein
MSFRLVCNEYSRYEIKKKKKKKIKKSMHNLE